jgi:hypothetical protein
MQLRAQAAAGDASSRAEHMHNGARAPATYARRHMEPPDNAPVRTAEHARFLAAGLRLPGGPCNERCIMTRRP